MEFLPSLDFTEDGGFSNVTLALPEMRTIASLLLRYNQCYILLLRPLLLRQLYSIVQENALLEPNSELASLNTECLRAATDNARIQHALSKCHRIAKFGFWESLHIFSSLTIHVMANFIKEKCPNAFSGVSDDSSYGPARDVLRQMAQAGNAASQDHERMIEDIENMFTIDSAHAGSTQSIEDLIGWSNYLESGNADLDLGLLGAFSS